MSDISNLLIKDSYDYVIQVDPITRQVLRIGGSVPTNPIFLSGLTVQESFKYSNGSESVGFFLKCDSQGNATWAPVNVSGNTYALTGVTVDGFNLYFTDSEGQIFPITITGGTLSSLIVTGNTIVNNFTANTIYTDSIYLSGTNIYDIFLRKECLPTIIGDKVQSNQFNGQPLKYVVIFNVPLIDDKYSPNISGKDVRVWSIEDKTFSGFTINTNSNVPLTDFVYWQVTSNSNFFYSGSCACTGTGTGSSGTTGTSGTSGINGTSGTSGINGSSGTSGTSGINGTSGSSGTSPNAVSPIDTISFTVDTGGVAPISSGLKSFFYLPYSGTILSWVVLSNSTGSTVIDIYKTGYDNYPPNSSNSIITSDYPRLDNNIKNKSTNLSGWTTTFLPDEILGFYVISAQTITRVQLILTVQK